MNVLNLSLIRHDENRGVSAARNTGIQAAQSKWIGLLDSDDEWHPDKWIKQRDALRQHPSMTLCHTDELWVRKGRRVNPMNKHKKHGGDIYLKCLPLCAMSPSSVVIKKEIFESIGLFDETLPACEDYDFWLRYCALYPVLFLDEALLTKYGGHDDQLSKAHWGMDRFRVKALQKQLHNPWLSPAYWEATRDFLLSKLRILEQGARKRDHTRADEYHDLIIQWSAEDRGHMQGSSHV
jgi:glycosyltransferase involved in cell wall biosynthesis